MDSWLDEELLGKSRIIISFLVLITDWRVQVAVGGLVYGNRNRLRISFRRIHNLRPFPA